MAKTVRRVFVGIVSVLLVTTIASSIVRIVMFHHVAPEKCRPLQHPMKVIDICLWAATLLLLCFFHCFSDSFEKTGVVYLEEGRIVQEDGEYASLQRPHRYKVTHSTFALLALMTLVITTSMFIVAFTKHCSHRR
ncbi:Hypothetical protein UVM_LOCUS39 [uncultured virus]|nr:Hypothetical protein UVM_LOCUS39 [uncultured virus]